ncbi:hypothetical protein [Methanoregula boonei]|nr:hypothetical protein [Methanoregula boonei]
MPARPVSNNTLCLLQGGFGPLCAVILILLCVVLACGCITPSSGQNSLPGNASTLAVPLSLPASLELPDSTPCPLMSGSGNVSNVPIITIDPVANHAAGDWITFTGTTNMAAGENLSLTVMSSNFQPCAKTETPPSYDSVNPCSGGVAATVAVSPGRCGANMWSWTVDTSQHGFQPGSQYLLIVTGRRDQVENTTLFTLVDLLKS